jgi:AraC-like DNA-binding protein
LAASSPRCCARQRFRVGLADEGTTYEKVVDQLRRTLALQYIMSISQIAWLLGYEGATSFNHAFKRWTGQSPFVARNEKRLPAPH